MFNKVIHSVKSLIALLVVGASLFCVLFGQGTHFHDLAIHIGKHVAIHAHVHAHDSHDEPLQGHHDQPGDDHRHEVKTASDIIGTLTTQTKVLTDELTADVFAPVISFEPVVPTPGEISFKFDLPPPGPAPIKYHLCSFSHRGPPLA